MQVVRFVRHDGDAPEVGLSDNTRIVALPVASMADLMLLRSEGLRQMCLKCEGPSYERGTVRLLPPLDGMMEVWAAGVTYKTSQLERMKESVSASTVYDLVYEAERPELFFKAAAWRVAGSEEPISVRADSSIDVPEPELALVLNAHGEVVGYSICNDVSSRSIEGENPLYLPQAKIYLGSCAVGPGIRPFWEIADPYALGIQMRIRREGVVEWEGSTSTSQLHRRIDALTEFLLRADVFPEGVVLATGTSLVPPLPFTLEAGDSVEISIDDIGTLVNSVVRGRAEVEWLATRARAMSKGAATTV